MEDLDVNPEVPMDIVTRPLPDGVTYIKTVFEYGGMPNYIGEHAKQATCKNLEYKQYF